jgi:low temperature requirement protein LtrA
VSSLLRNRDAGDEQRVTWLELFFDLVFVFAITQLSHYLLEHLTMAGAAETLLLLLVVWWAWGYTTWMTNWWNPESPTVRLVLIVVMLASLLLSIAIPEAFGDRAVLFAASYAALQIVRNLFAAATAAPGSALRATFARILAWSLAVGVVWVVGATLDDSARVAVWLVALAIDYAGPYARYWTPGLGRSRASDWAIEGSHFAERYQLFVIIALGESIVVTGITASSHPLDATRGVAIAVSFIGSAALWWLYFDYVARIAPLRLIHAAEPGRLARDAYTYLHLPIVAGIVVAAVGDELVIAHPGERLDTPELAALAGGPALYLLGHVGFRWRMTGSPSGRRLAAAGAVCAAGAIGGVLPALAASGLVVAVLVGLIAWETIARARRRARGEPSPIERFLAQQAAAGSAAARDR